MSIYMEDDGERVMYEDSEDKKEILGNISRYVGACTHFFYRYFGFLFTHTHNVIICTVIAQIYAFIDYETILLLRSRVYTYNIWFFYQMHRHAFQLKLRRNFFSRLVQLFTRHFIVKCIRCLRFFFVFSKIFFNASWVTIATRFF